MNSGKLRMLHVPQIDPHTSIITCMKDGCHWSYPEPGPGAQESFEEHISGKV